jgi:hypothetical protein
VTRRGLVRGRDLDELGLRALRALEQHADRRSGLLVAEDRVTVDGQFLPLHGIGVMFGDGSPMDSDLSIGCGDPRLSLVGAS